MMAAAPAPVSGNVAQVPGLIALAIQLADLLERETALVRALKIAEIAPLQNEKTRLTQAFRKALKQLGGPANLPPSAKPQWLAAGRRLTDAATENERALRAGRAATERLIATIVSAVKQSRQPHAVYSRRQDGSRAPQIAGIALDRRL